jgi:hypothetical protein
MPFVPDDFEPPTELSRPELELEPLGPEHNDSDYAAWTSSIEHIRSSPGYAGDDWPREMTLDENRADLERHARDFAARTGFTYTVREPRAGRVIGCVYIYPVEGGDGARVQSWVTADRAELDRPLRALVRAWLRDAWPFAHVEYEG